MKDQDRTKEQCIQELEILRRRISELEASEARLTGIKPPIPGQIGRLTEETDRGSGAVNSGGDVTDLEQACQALMSEKAQLLAIFDSVEAIIQVVDPRTYEVLYVNEYAKKMYGNPKIGGLCHKEFYGSETPCDFCNNNSLLAGKDESSVRELHNRLLKRDFTVSNRIIRWPDGRDAKLALFLDMTERKQAEEALGTSKERYRAVVDNIEVGISVLNAKMEIVEVNHALKRYFPHVRPACGQICYEQYNDPPRSAPCSYCPCVLTFQDGKVHEVITETPAGSEIRRYHVVSSPITDSQGRVQYTIELTEDITERLRAEEALRESEQTLKAILAASPVGIVVTRDRRIKWANDAWILMFGFTDEEQFLDRPTSIMHHSQEDYERARRTLYDGLQYGRVSDADLTLRRRDGEPFDANVRVKLVDSSDPSKGAISVISDISDRKKAEEDLRKSKERLDLALRGANLGLWDWNCVADEAVISDSSAALIGRTIDEIDKNYGFWEELLHPDDRQRAVKEVFDHLSGSSDYYEGEYRVRHKSGEWRWILSRGKVMERDSGGKALRMTGTYLDVTDKKLAESRASEANELREKIFSESPVGIAVYRTDGQCVSANEALGKIVGADRERLLAQNFWNMSSWKESGLLAEAGRVLSGGRSDHGEIRLTSEFGKTVWVKERMARITSGGEPHLLTVLTDITERKMAEAALRENEGKLKGISNSVQDAIIVVNDKGEISFWNPAAERMFGYTASETLEKNVHELLAPPELADAYYTGVHGFAETGRGAAVGRTLPLTAIRRNGDQFPVELSLSSFLMDGRWHAVGAARDITERKKAEEALRESEQRYRNLFENAPLMYIITRNRQGAPFIVDCNDLFLSSLGYSREEVQGKPLADFYSPDSRADLLERGGYSRALAGEFFIGERELVTRGGEIIPTLLYTMTELDPAGQVVGVRGMFVDITKRKKAEAQADRANKDWERTFKAISDGVMVVDDQYRIIRANKAVADALGVREQELTGKFCFELVHGVTKPPDSCPHSLLLADGEEHTAEVVEPRLGGIHELRVSPVVDQNGQVTGSVHVIRNITQRKQAEAELQRSNSLLRATIEAAPTPIISVDLDGNVQTVWNPAAEKMLGWSANEVVGRPIPSVPTESRDQFRAFQEEIRAGETLDGVEVKRQRRDGTLVDCSVYASPLHDTEGRINGYIGVLVDMTERKRAEEALRESEAFYRNLYENISDCIFIIDVTADLRFKFVGFNPAQEMAVGMTTEQVANKFIEDVFSEDLANHLTDKCLVCVDERKVIYFEKAIDLPKGRLSFYTSLAPIAGIDGSIYRIIGMARDITEQKNLQNQLLHAQKMKAIGTLASGIAHDFNNLLQAIVGCTDLLLMRRSQDDPDLKKLRTIRHAAQDGADLVSRILTFSRKAESNIRPLDLNEEILRIEPLVRRTLTKMVRVKLVLADDLNIIDADPTQIEQVLLNLAVNARQAMPDGGQLLIETNNVSLRDEYLRTHLEAKPGKYVLLTVSDTGVGMAPDVVDRMFEPFYTTKANGEGTGLGLATVHGIVMQHKGHITCYSEPGMGTSFKIYFPVSLTDSAPDMAITAQMPAFGTETILLVDDDDRLRETGAEMLTLVGYQVLAASSGEDALAIYASRMDEISLVILDWIMPGMGGKRCLEELRTIDPKAKVIVASGYSSDALPPGEMKSGANGFLRKPYDAKDILIAIRRVLDRGDL